MPLLDDKQISALSAAIQRTPDCPGRLSKQELHGCLAGFDAWWESEGLTAANNAMLDHKGAELKPSEAAILFREVLTAKHAEAVTARDAAAIAARVEVKQ